MSKKLHQKGYRLQYIEIFNWGTFDEMIWRLDPKGDNSLLTGANGSGKTTLVDAILTLLVPPNLRHYNQSSGSKSRRERDEKTYTLGAYTTVQSDSGLAAKTQYLRTRDAFSILLGTFYNADTKDYVTLAQVRWFSNNDLKRSYLIIPSAVTISEHFQPMDTGGIWKKQLKKKQKAEEFTSFSKYSQRFSKLFGLKSEKALTLFAQTVGIKVLGNLNDFIRQNMLEAYDAEYEFQKLYEHYESLLQAHKSIEKAKQQARLLQPIVDGGVQFQDLSAEVEKLEQVQDAVTPFFAKEKKELYQKNIRSSESDIQKKNNRIESIKAEISSFDAQRNDLQVSISTDKAYEQIQNLDKQIQQLEQEIIRKQNRANRYNKLAEFLDIKADPNEKIFYKNLADSKVAIDKLKTEGEELENKEVQTRIELDQIQRTNKELESQLLSLQKRQNSIPLAQINIRAQLLEKLNLKETELPFVAELMQVNDKKWESIIEQLFSSIGLNLLVKEQFYEDILNFVHRSKLEGTITFIKTPILDFSNADSEIKKKSILQYLDFKPNNEFVPFLKKHLIQHFNFETVKGTAAIQKIPFSINEKGLWRLENQHHRHIQNEDTEQTKHILGWDNRSTILSVQRSLKAKKEAVENLHLRLKNSRIQRDTIQKKRDTLLNLATFEQFSEVDWKGATKSMQNFQKEKQTLLKSSNQLQDLEEQLQQVKLNISNKEKEKEKLIEQKGNLQNRLQGFSLNLEEAKATLERFKNVQLKSLTDTILALIPEDDQQFIASSIDRIERQTTKITAQQKDKKARELASTERKLSLAMQKFITPGQEILQEYPSWTAETIDFMADVKYLKQFEQLHTKITTEDLPKHQKRFKDWLNERMIFDIANFKTALENQEAQIKESIDEINSSLLEIDFNADPKTFIQLDISKTRDISVRDFKQMIKDAMPDPAKLIKGDEAELESSFKKIKKIIEELASNENWRKKVTDVRNWLEFAADERYRNDQTQRQYYVDSQSLSGGEKAKLAYTILASAIAYQFGIRNEGRRAKSFRFAVVDEAFSKVDPENSVYAMELFKQLDLQLMVVTPLDKINLAEPYIRSVHFVQNRAKRNSEVYDLPMKVYQQQKEHFSEVSSEVTE